MTAGGTLLPAEVCGVPAAAQPPGRGGRAWRRLRQDRAAMLSLAFLLVVGVVALAAPLIVGWFGHPPAEGNTRLLDPDTGAPLGRFGGISGEHLLGVEPVSGRDLFSRVVYGARVSLLVALAATAVAVVVGTVLGVLAGYLRGWVDALVSRTMDLLLSIPVLLFALALAALLPDEALGLSTYGLHVGLMVLVIAAFTWPYVGRIVRGQVISLREREFVEAARSLGAGPLWIMRREILPHLVGPLLVYATLLIPTNILFEAALSFLGVGVPAPEPSWGGMLSDAASGGLYTIAPMFLAVPGLALLLTVMAFNLLGDGLRDALDPHSPSARPRTPDRSRRLLLPRRPARLGDPSKKGLTAS